MTLSMQQRNMVCYEIPSPIKERRKAFFAILIKVKAVNFYMTERDFQKQFSVWKKHHKEIGGALELKFSKTDSLPFLRLEEHQERALCQARTSQLCFKIPDVGYQNPCDMICTSGQGWVVVMFHVKRGVKHFYIIDILDWLNEAVSSDRRSLTEHRASAIGHRFELA